MITFRRAREYAKDGGRNRCRTKTDRCIQMARATIIEHFRRVGYYFKLSIGERVRNRGGILGWSGLTLR